ncbi:MAG: hypothetical protein M3457_06685, partial [Chloroflexota bacterium]|nr:hypothetical protein [Chloroflexota bacterium]
HNQNVGPSEGPVRFIDVIGDKSGSDAGEYLLTSVLFDYRPAYTQLIQQLGDGTFGDVYTMSLENEGVRLLDMTGTAAAETVTEVEAAQAAIIDGSIEVPAIGDADGVHALLDELFPR